LDIRTGAIPCCARMVEVQIITNTRPKMEFSFILGLEVERVQYQKRFAVTPLGVRCL
jgi:hypothetical protein